MSEKSQTNSSGLNVPVQEHDACGTGYVIGDRALPYALDLVVKNDHRIGRNPSRPGDTIAEIGDGAGIVTEIPYAILSKAIPRINAMHLQPGDYGVARIYLPGTSRDDRARSQEIISRNLKASYFDTIGSRKVKGDIHSLAESIRPAHSFISDIAFTKPSGMDSTAFRKAMYDCQMNIERELEQNGLSGCHIGAMNDRITVYKGVFTASQLGQFFGDFKDPEFKTRFAFYHGRFATNAATRLPNVHPFVKGSVALGHNGEIVTIKGNRERLERAIRETTGKEFTIPQGITDSHTLGYALAFLCDSKHIDAAEAMKHLVSAGWRNDVRLSDATKDTLETFSAGSAPYAGPAYIGFIDATGADIKINSIMDFAGLRPCNIMTLKDGTVITGSENALPDGVKMDDVTSLRSLKPLEQVQFDVATGKMTRNEELLDNVVARNKEATERFRQRLVNYASPTLPTEAEASVVAGNEGMKFTQRQFALGHDKQTQEHFAEGMAKTGAPPVGAMGKATPAWYLTDVPAGLSRAARAAFSIVTAPPHDAKRESYLMDMTSYIGNLSDDNAKIIKLPSAILPYKGLEALEGQMKQLGIRSETLDCTFDTTQDFNAFKSRLKELTDQAVRQVKGGAGVLVLSDMNVSENRQAIDNMLIAALIHKRLDKEGLRNKVSLVFDSGSIRTEHEAFMLLTDGIDAVYPGMHYAGVIQASKKGELKYDDRNDKEKFGKPVPLDLGLANAQKGMELGVINAISRCGIPSLSAARDAQLFSFEGVRITPEEKEFSAAFGGHNPVYSPLGVYGLEKVWENARELHSKALEITGTSLPDAKPFFQFGKQDAQEAMVDTSSMKQWADEMARVRTHFAVLEYIPADILRNAESANPEDLAGIKSAAEAAIKQAHGLRAATYLKALEETQLDEIKLYGRWKELHDATPDITVRFAPPGGHKERMVQLGKAPGTEEEPQYTERQLHLLNEAAVNGFKLRPSHRIAFAAMDDFERSNPRGLMDMLFINPNAISEKPAKPIAASEIAKHMYVASMSVGALTPSANRLLSQVANSVGIKKETGEGGMSPKDQNLGVREDDHSQDRVVQIGSARFGVDIAFVISPDRWVNEKFVPGSVTIKMAQGAKPGEGGQLPGVKVTPLIAALRNAFPGVDLPSPAPHHDIYSIEDLYQLVRDCKRTAVKGVERPIGVKIASSGPDVFAVGLGVAKMGVDYITYAAGDGGTGAGPITSIHYAGRGLEDAILLSRKLSEAGFINHPKRYYEGGIKTPLDFVRLTAAGFSDVGFGSAAAIAEGCKMLQRCNKAGQCAPGVANNEEKFDIDPRTTQEYFLAFMQGVSDILSKMRVDGKPVESLDQIRGRTDVLELLAPKQQEGKCPANWDDLHRLLAVDPKSLPKYDSAAVRKPNANEQKGYQLEDWMIGRVHDLAIESQTLKDHREHLKRTKKIAGSKLYDWTMEKQGDVTVVNGSSPIDSTQFIGSGLGAFVAAVNGYLKANPDSSVEEVIRKLNIGEPLGEQKANPDHPSMWRKKTRGDKTPPSLRVNLKLNGHGAQSFGVFTPEGINYDIEGALQYGAFKMASGGEHVIRSHLGRDGMAAGNSFGYGARGGFFAVEGNLGPRAGVRNAGANYVIDGDVGDNSFTFMSRGSVVLLGDPGINFGAGSSAGMMAVYDKEGTSHLSKRCDKKSVSVHALSDAGYSDYEDAIRIMLQQHVDMLEKSAGGRHESRAKEILDHWLTEKDNFYVVVPKFLESALNKLAETTPDAERYKSDVRTAYTKPDGSAEPEFSPLEGVWAHRHGLAAEPMRMIAM